MRILLERIMAKVALIKNLSHLFARGVLLIDKQLVQPFFNDFEYENQNQP